MATDESRDARFPSRFAFTVLDDLQRHGDLPRYYYPGANRQGGRDGLLVEIRPDHTARWVGVFGFGDVSTRTVTGVYSMPDPDRICVVARGQGYVVRAAAPELWELVPAVPVTDVVPIPARSLLVFATFTILLAYGDNGVRWRSQRMSSDGLQIRHVSETTIDGSGVDAASGSDTHFSLDLATGRRVDGPVRRSV